jgi:arylsulfatase
MLYTFNTPDEPERHDVQYFEMFCNRGIYYKGWSAVTRHSTPWEMNMKLPAFTDDVWELYDGKVDYSQAHNLAKENPEMLRKLQRVFLIEATKYNVLPLDDRRVERFIPAISGRPTVVRGKKQIYFPGMKRISEATVIDHKNKSFQVTAQIVVPDGGAQGTIVALGGGYGGWGLVMEKGAARFVYNLFGINVFVTDAAKPVPAGEHQVRMEFAYAGGGPAKGGAVTLYYDGEQVGEGKIAVTQPVIFSATEGLDIGREMGTPVLPKAKSEDTVFNGEIKWVELSVGNDDQSHLVKPEDLMHMLLSKQ